MTDPVEFRKELGCFYIDGTLVVSSRGLEHIHQLRESEGEVGAYELFVDGPVYCKQSAKKIQNARRAVLNNINNALTGLIEHPPTQNAGFYLRANIKKPATDRESTFEWIGPR